MKQEREPSAVPWGALVVLAAHSMAAIVVLLTFVWSAAIAGTEGKWSRTLLFAAIGVWSLALEALTGVFGIREDLIDAWDEVNEFRRR